jgi:heptosyltransferase-2
MSTLAPARLVVRAPNWLGDIVMALPAIGMIRAGFPEAELTVAVPPAFAPVFDQQTGAGLVEVIEPGAIGAGGFDTIILLTNSFGSAWAARRAGVAERWGYAAAGRRLLLTRAVRRPRGRVHQVEYYRTLARELGMPEGDEVPRLVPDHRTLELAAAVIESERLGESPLVGVAPGAAYGHAKRWPPAYVAEVIESLATRAAVTCVLFGAASDRDAGREIESALGRRTLAPGHMVNLIGRTDLRRLVGLLTRCAAFVTNDSGAMHLAAALGTPVVALFGPTDERVTAPRGPAVADVLTEDVFCRPCMLRDCPIDHRCMKRIPPARVLEAIAPRLNDGPRAQPARSGHA